MVFQLRVYAGKDITGIIQDSGNTRYVGFSLPSSSVSPYDTRAESDFWLYVVYVLSTFILYASCLTTLFFVVSKSEQKGIKAFTKRNPEVLVATIIVIGSFVIVEICAELIMAIIWTVSVKDHLIGFTVFAAAFVYYGPGVFSLYKVGRKCYRYYNGVNDVRDITTRFNRPLHDIDAAKIDAVFKCFVWIIAYFAYVLLYSFFPAFVLAFAYPTRVITMFAFIATFLVLSIVYLTTYIKKGVTLKSLKDVRFIKIIFCIVLMILLLYFFLFIFALLYSLVIGRASVVSSAPLAVLSLLPSILTSIAAWVMKSTMLNNGDGGIIDESHDSEVQNEDRQSEIEGNQNGEVTQNEESHSSEENYDEIDTETIQNEEVISSTTLIPTENSCCREEKEANGDSAIKMRLIEEEESCSKEEKELELETKI